MPTHYISINTKEEQYIKDSLLCSRTTAMCGAGLPYVSILYLFVSKSRYKNATHQLSMPSWMIRKKQTQ